MARCCAIRPDSRSFISLALINSCCRISARQRIVIATARDSVGIGLEKWREICLIVVTLASAGALIIKRSRMACARSPRAKCALRVTYSSSGNSQAYPQCNCPARRKHHHVTYSSTLSSCCRVVRRNNHRTLLLVRRHARVSSM